MMLVYTTCKNASEARRMSELLLTKRLIACSNSFPIDSRYRWKGKMVHGKEYGVYLKTTERVFPRMKTELERIHPYELPCIIGIKIKANESYEQWVRDDVR